MTQSDMAGLVAELREHAAGGREQFGDNRTFDLLDHAAQAIEDLTAPTPQAQVTVTEEMAFAGAKALHQEMSNQNVLEYLSTHFDMEELARACVTAALSHHNPEAT